MVFMSLSGKKHAIPNTDALQKAKRRDTLTGSIMISAAALVGFVLPFFIQKYPDMAVESVYVLVTGFILLGLVIILNARYKRMDQKAILIDRKIFHTPIPFNIAATGIIGILAVLYAVFW